MIELLDGFPVCVVAAKAQGRVTKRDYDEILTPKVDEIAGRCRQLRCYYELGVEFSGFDAGAAWEDFRLGMEHFAHWERVAVVSDLDWIRLAVSAFRFLLPGQVRVFGTSDLAEARRWIGAD
jgi:hypothetical protein